MDSATPSFKFPHPTPFNGKRDGFSIIGFLKRMNFFFDGAGIAEPRKITVTLAFAGDEVIAWWTLLNQPSTTQFDDFSKLLSSEFSPAKFKEHILALTMKMTMSLPLNIPNVMAYITKAREYHLLLQTYYNDNSVLNDTIRTAFLSGAPAQLRQMLEVAIINAGEDDIDLPKLFKAAEEFGRIFHSSDSSLGAKALAVTGSSAGITNSMAMELDNIGTSTMASLLQTINDLSIQVNNLSRNNNSNRPPRLGKLTFAEKQELMANNGCFRCRKNNAGHIASNCPSYSTTSGRSINHVSFANESGSQSGNASGN